MLLPMNIFMRMREKKREETTRGRERERERERRIGREERETNEARSREG